MTYILRFSEVGKDDIAEVGGKGANLGELVGVGLPVPPGFCVTAQAYRDFLAEAGLQQPIREMLADMQPDDLEDVKARSESIQDLIIQSGVPAEIVEGITEAYRELCDELEQPDLPVAVRSSATAEDLPGASFAGQQETYLNVRGVDSLLEHSRLCWASLWSHPAVTYRHEQGFEHEKVYLCIVVQAMIEAEVAGILFTANPVNGNRDEALLNASWGLGEAVVSGLVTPDTISVRRSEGRILDYAVGSKEMAIHYADDGGILEIDTTEDQRRSQALSDPQVLELAAIGGNIEEHYGSPQDIEWALRKGKWYVLQSRPITTLREQADLYNRSMFVEIFPDPLSPAFLSVVPPLFKSMLDFTLEYWGFSLPKDRPAVGVYYNQPYWNQDYIEAAFSSLSPEVRDPLVSAIASPFGRHGAETKRELSLPYVRMALNTLRFMIRFPKQMPGLIAKYRDQVAAVSNMPLEDASDQEIIDAIRELVLDYTSPLLNYDFLMIAVIGRSYEMLGTFLEPSFGARTEELRAKLISGVTGNVTMEGNKRLWDLAMTAKASPEVSRVLRETDEKEIGAALKDLPEAAPFLEQLEAFSREYGHREIRMDILYPTWGEDPAPVYGFVRGYLDADESRSPYVQQERLVKERSELTEEALAGIKQSLVGRYLLSPIFRWLLHQTQLHTRERDTMHFEFTRAFPLFRRFLQELGQRWVKNDWIDEPEDIYFLSLDEMDEVAQSQVPMKDQIREARQELDTNRRRPWPTIIRGEEEIYAQTETAEGDLQGISGSPGVVSGPARVIRGPDEFGKLQRGEILVAPLTNPSWTPLFAIASAVITEVGGILSHGAIVAREYGIPAVMSVPGVTNALSDGQMITVDGNRGVVLVEGVGT
ncbi:MAG: PEP-utilizing enzyme [Chloroflexi bacterium]|nr:PEP-utilizing enzyme [Chloroflexota bacterium]